MHDLGPGLPPKPVLQLCLGPAMAALSLCSVTLMHALLPSKALALCGRGLSQQTLVCQPLLCRTSHRTKKYPSHEIVFSASSCRLASSPHAALPLRGFVASSKYSLLSCVKDENACYALEEGMVIDHIAIFSFNYPRVTRVTSARETKSSLHA